LYGEGARFGKHRGASKSKVKSHIAEATGYDHADLAGLKRFYFFNLTSDFCLVFHLCNLTSDF